MHDRDGHEAPDIFLAVGEGRLYHGGRPVDLSRRENDVLCAIALARRPMATDVLLDSVWPDEEPVRTRASLKVHVHRIRRKIGAPKVIGFSGGLWSLDGRVRIDFHELRTIARTTDSNLSGLERIRLEAAYDLLIGPPPGIFARSALAGTIDSFRRGLLFDIASKLASEAIERREFTTVMSIARDLRTHDDSTTIWRDLAVRADAGLRDRFFNHIALSTLQ